MNSNTLKLIGYIQQAPELKMMSNGQRVTTVTLACPDDNIPANFEYIPVTAFGLNADTLARRCVSGSRVCVIGHVVSRINEKAGKKYFNLFIHADSVSPMDGLYHASGAKVQAAVDYAAKIKAAEIGGGEK